MTEVLALVAVGVLSLCAVVLSAAETSLTRLRQSQARVLIEEEPTGTSPLGWLLGRRRQTLAVVAGLVLACHLGVATLVAFLAQRRWGPGALAAAFAVEFAVLYLATAIGAKSVAMRRPERVARFVAPILRVLVVFTPLRLLMGVGLSGRFGQSERVEPEAVSEEELLAVAEWAAADESIEVQEHRLIESVISFGDTIAREVMVPRTDMVAIEATLSVSEALEVALFNGLTRIPVYGEGIDDIVGLAHVRDLIAAVRDEGDDRPVGEVMRETGFVPDTKRTAELLREMQGGRSHLVILVDEFGGTAGLVTLEDLLEEMVGEITDEFDVEQALVEDVGEGAFRVSGRVPLSDLSEVLQAELPSGRWSTVGGLIFTMLGRVPAEGESLDVNGHRFLVERVQRRRIARVLVTGIDSGPAA
ncbi:MAG: hemolysin family protein [bacterium]|nr:hemolysin family protein [bacterium]MCY3924601.1 hemolysin family protein [bacterium]